VALSNTHTHTHTHTRVLMFILWYIYFVNSTKHQWQHGYDI